MIKNIKVQVDGIGKIKLILKVNKRSYKAITTKQGKATFKSLNSIKEVHSNQQLHLLEISTRIS